MGMRRLIICEKDNAAKRIATILSDGSFRKEMVNGVPVYRFSEGGHDVSVIGLRGHILSLDYEAKYSIWHRIKPRDLIALDPKKRVIAHNIAGALTRLAADTD
jgi:DNA topoisomerase-1